MQDIEGRKQGLVVSNESDWDVRELVFQELGRVFEGLVRGVVVNEDNMVVGVVLSEDAEQGPVDAIGFHVVFGEEGDADGNLVVELPYFEGLAHLCLLAGVERMFGRQVGQLLIL